jgi:hypothetical protein
MKSNQFPVRQKRTTIQIVNTLSNTVEVECPVKNGNGNSNVGIIKALFAQQYEHFKCYKIKYK